ETFLQSCESIEKFVLFCTDYQFNKNSVDYFNRWYKDVFTFINKTSLNQCCKHIKSEKFDLIYIDNYQYSHKFIDEIKDIRKLANKKTILIINSDYLIFNNEML